MSHQFDLEPEFLALHELCRDHTMTSIERMYALWSATNYAVDNNLPGAFVECGVWRGGSVMLMALTSADARLSFVNCFRTSVARFLVRVVGIYHSSGCKVVDFVRPLDVHDPVTWIPSAANSARDAATDP
jgi:hypothetical protein